MEFLIPYKRRQDELTANCGKINHLEIAEKYKVPRVLVEKYFSDTYMDELGKLIDE